VGLHFVFYFFSQNNQVVGVGSGSTIVYAVDRLGKTFNLILSTYAYIIITNGWYFLSSWEGKRGEAEHCVCSHVLPGQYKPSSADITLFKHLCYNGFIWIVDLGPSADSAAWSPSFWFRQTSWGEFGRGSWILYKNDRSIWMFRMMIGKMI